MPGADPGEGYVNTNQQLFGSTKAPTPPMATNTGFVTNFASAIAYDTANHYGIDRRHHGRRTSWASSRPSALPVLSGLAKGFAVCDHWYGSVPTETMPEPGVRLRGDQPGAHGRRHQVVHGAEHLRADDRRTT